ncbi:23S rRNA (uracil1939-C5)-methyltransferase [Clostridiales Family XIII bacterium PM5-7]
MEKGQRVQIKIEDQTSEGQGVGRSNGLAVFVAGAVVGDLVTAELTKVKKNYAFGRLVELIEPSKDRIEPMCEYMGSLGQASGRPESLDGEPLGQAAGRPETLDREPLGQAASRPAQCGGCPYGSLSYEAQLRVKENQVREKLSRLGGIAEPVIRPIIGMEQPFRYRNKATMPIWTGGVITRKGGILENLGEPAVGFYKGKSHDVVDCQDCMLQSAPAMAAAEALRQFMKEDNITAYDPKWEKGLMRHLIVKTAHATGEVMVVLVINGKGIPNVDKLVGMLDEAIYNAAERENGFPAYSLESVVVNVHKGKGTAVMGEECVTVAGKPTILEQAGGLVFEVSPLSFYQVNPVQMEVLYDKAMEYAALTGSETVLDLYCGIGTIGLFAAKAGAAKVIGIESVKKAVLDANRNAVLNGIVNARYVCGRAEDELPRLMGMQTLDKGTAKDEEDTVDAGLCVDDVNVVFLDPPRAGCDQRLLEAVVTAAPERIVYVSCDPATLARDVKYLSEQGYRFEEATPVDMFPWTGHVECVCLMSRVEG